MHAGSRPIASKALADLLNVMDRHDRQGLIRCRGDLRNDQFNARHQGVAGAHATLSESDAEIESRDGCLDLIKVAASDLGLLGRQTGGNDARR